jgi:hypothetical protein
MSVNALFILIGGIIFLGIAGAYLFEKTRIPDVLILMGFRDVGAGGDFV